MSLTELATFIKDVGFPIVACCAMFYFTFRTMDQFKKSVDRIESSTNELIKLVEVMLEGRRKYNHVPKD